MRIQSNFRDYYDGVQIFGFERSLLYLRRREEILDRSSSSGPKAMWGMCELPSNCSYHTIHFCGTCFSLLRITNQVRLGGPSPYALCETHSHHFYSYEAFVKHLEKVKYKNIKTVLKQKKYYEKWFTPVSTSINDSWNCPIVLFVKTKETYEDGWPRYSGIWEKNPKLSDWQFGKIKHAQQAYQEIYQWLANRASPEKPIPKIDDVTMAEAKGFDKYSFRKDKQK